jgi:hypothetical protein
MTTATPQVTEGAVRISSVTPILIHDDVEVWDIDCYSKYASILTFGTTKDMDETSRPHVVLQATEDTLHTKPGTAELTTIEFAPRDREEQWGIMVDGGRYLFTVTLYRYPTPDTDTSDLLDLAWRAEN